jgi:sugar lactone lactonase YvrE
LDKPYLAVGQDGSFFVTDPENSRLLQFGANGDLLATINRLGSDKTSFNLPIGIAVDASGSLYVADSKNNRIQKFEAVR